MSFSDVSGASKYFVTPNEGFSTTTSGTVASGATTVGLNSVAGLTNGTTFVGVIEPAGTKEQIFTGVVDTSGSQITGVVWTKGSNIEHATGVSVVDYDTGTALKLITTGLLKEHTQTGTHGAITGTSANVTGALTGTSLVNAIHTHANNAGGGQLTGSSALVNSTVTADKLSTGAASATVATSQTYASAAYGDLATVGPSVTVTIGANGLALIIISARAVNDTGAASAQVGVDISGATTVAATSTKSLYLRITSGAPDIAASYAYVHTGLTAGSTTFKLKYANSAGTATFQDRTISVIPL